MAKRPLLLMILDGWGMPTGKPGDAISKSNIPNFRKLWQDYPHTTLAASELAVGLPEGQMGNSEVGHLNIGAGRVVYQDITAIDQKIKSGEFHENPMLKEAMTKAKACGVLHLMGLVSDGGIHSHIRHLGALLAEAKRQGVAHVYLHCFTDGRDTLPESGAGFISQLIQLCETMGIGEIATVIGRYYGMDRDHRWERTKQAYDAMVYGKGNPADNPLAAIQASYERGITDEFLEPVVMVDGVAKPVATIHPGEPVVFFNFRSDRARQISSAFTEPDFTGFDRGLDAPLLDLYTFTQYSKELTAPIIFPPEDMTDILSEVLSQAGKKQLHIAETEKYAHVTFFFNGRKEVPYPGEDRILIPSPQVATYDLQPEMSAPEVTEKVVQAILDGQYDVIILNFANPDMLGHTGKMAAIVQGLEYIDSCIGRIAEAIDQVDGMMLVTADHGNVEKVLDEEGHIYTAHTVSPVPFILVGKGYQEGTVILREGGRLSDIAPTILELLGIVQPEVMTGVSLLLKSE